MRRKVISSAATAHASRENWYRLVDEGNVVPAVVVNLKLNYWACFISYSHCKHRENLCFIA